MMSVQIKTYQLEPTMYGDCLIEMPKNAEILSIVVVNGRPFISAIVDTSLDNENVSFFIEYPNKSRESIPYVDYIGVFVINRLIGHVFILNK